MKALLLLSLAITSGCVENSYRAGFEQKYGSRTYDLVNKSKRISYFEVDPYYEDTLEVPRIGEYAVISEMTPVERLDKKKLKELLTDYKNYNSEGLNWACTFAPTYGFRFYRKSQQAYLLVSPVCDKAKFLIEGDTVSKFIDYSLLIQELGEIINE